MASADIYSNAKISLSLRSSIQHPVSSIQYPVSSITSPVSLLCKKTFLPFYRQDPGKIYSSILFVFPGTSLPQIFFFFQWQIIFFLHIRRQTSFFPRPLGFRRVPCLPYSALHS